MAFSANSLTASPSFLSTLFSTAQKKESLENALNTLINNFLDQQLNHSQTKDLLTDSNATKLFKSIKKHQVDLTGHAVNALVYEATLADKDIALANKYRELAEVLLEHSNHTQVALSLIGLNIPIEFLARLNLQEADNSKVLAKLVTAVELGQRTESQVIAIISKRVGGLELDELVCQAVKLGQKDLAMQLLLYSANGEKVLVQNEQKIPTSHGAQGAQGVEGMIPSTKDDEANQHALFAHLQSVFTGLIAMFAKMGDLIHVETMMASFKKLLNNLQLIYRSEQSQFSPTHPALLSY